MSQEYELRVATAVPVAFQDEKTKIDVFIECQASAMVVPFNDAQYPNRETVNQIGEPLAAEYIATVITSFSGKADALRLTDSKKEIEQKFAVMLEGAGLRVTSMEFFKLGPDENSEKQLNLMASMAQMTNDASLNAAPAGANAMLEMMRQANTAAAAQAQSESPKFCTYCGAKATGKFCSCCGAQIGQ